jgi:hypothetical protein
MGQQFSHGIDEWLDTDETGCRVLLGTVDEMLSTAKADFQTNTLNRLWKSCPSAAGAGWDKSTFSSGSLVAIMSACRSRNGLPLRRPKNASVARDRRSESIAFILSFSELP